MFVRVTRLAGEGHDYRYQFCWSAWMDGQLVAKGYAYSEANAYDQAHDAVRCPEL